MSNPALELQQVPHGVIRPLVEMQVGCTAASRGKQKADGPENAEAEGTETHKF